MYIVPTRKVNDVCTRLITFREYVISLGDDGVYAMQPVRSF